MVTGTATDPATGVTHRAYPGWGPDGKCLMVFGVGIRDWPLNERDVEIDCMECLACFGKK